MILSLLTGLAINNMTARSADAEPIVAQATSVLGLWRVELDGTPFIVDTGSPISLLDGQLLTAWAAKTTVKCGPFSLDPREMAGLDLRGMVAILPGDGFSVSGVLGMDLLGDFALGFDRKAKTLTFWRGGLDADKAKAWVLEGSGADAKCIQLETFRLPGDPRPMLYPPIGSNMPLMFDSGSNGADSPFGETLTDFHPVGFTKSQTLYGQKWQREGWTMQASLGGIGEGWHLIGQDLAPSVDTWAVGTEYFEGDRLLVDLPNFRITAASSIEAQLARAWHELGLRLDGGRLYLNFGGENAKRLHEYLGREVTEIAGTNLQQITEKLRRGEPTAGEALGKLYASMKAGCSATVRVDDHLVTVQIVPPSPPPTAEELERAIKPPAADGSSPMIVFPAGQVAPVFAGESMIPVSWKLKNVRKGWIRPGPAGHVTVTVPH